MKMILVPTDFSPASTNACRYAVDFAYETGANVLLLYIYSVPVMVGDMTMVPYSMAELEKAHTSDLRKLSRQLLEKHGEKVKISYKVRLNGDKEDEICEMARSKQVDLIIMGITEKGTLEEFFTGTTSMRVVRHTSSSVLIIPEKTTYHPPSEIILATDYIAIKNKMELDTLKMLLKLFKAHLHVYNLLNEAEGFSVDIARLLIENSLQGTPHTIRFFKNEDDHVQKLNEFAETKHAGMIAIVPHKDSFWQRLFKESDTQKLVFHSSLPILVLPDPGNTHSTKK